MLTNSLWHEIFWKKKSRLQPKSLGMVYSVQSQAAPVETQLRREPGLLALADSTGRDRLGGRPTPRRGGRWTEGALGVAGPLEVIHYLISSP